MALMHAAYANFGLWHITAYAYSLRYIWTDVTVISDHNTISMSWGKTVYGVKLRSEDLSIALFE